jgi:hypothetical protein
MRRGDGHRYVPILFAVSPLRAMRSAPTTTAATFLARIVAAAAPSTIKVAGTPAAASSKVVKRAPCSSGRVSSTKTCTRLPRRCAATITPSAVPSPPVASGPVLQWVNTEPCVGHQGRAEFAQRAIDRALLGVDRQRFVEIGAALRGQHAVDRPSKLTAVGRAVANARRRPRELRVVRAVRVRQRDAVGAESPDARRAAHRKADDGGDDGVDVLRPLPREFVRKQTLIDVADRTVIPPNGIQTHEARVSHGVRPAP